MNAHENLFLSGICSVTIEVVAVIVAGGFVSLVSPTYKQYFSAIFFQETWITYWKIFPEKFNKFH